MAQARLAAGAAAISGFLVGAGIVATRYVIGETDPASLALLRYLIGVCFLLPPTLFAGRVAFRQRDLVPIALLGIGQFGILIVLLNFGLQHVGSGRAALIFSSFPLMTMVLAAILGQERLTGHKTAGVLLTILGVALVFGEKAFEGGAGSDWRGELAVLASAFCGAVCSVLYRPYLGRYPPLAVSTMAMFAAVLFLAVLAAREGFFDAVPSFSAGGWIAVGFIGFASGLGYYLWLWALKHTTPTRVTVFLCLSPATAAVFGAWFLAETVTWPFLLGLVAVGVGLAMAHRDG